MIIHSSPGQGHEICPVVCFFLGVLSCDFSGSNEICQVRVKEDHALFRAHLYRGVDLMPFAFTDEVEYGFGPCHDLKGSDAPFAFRPRYESLGNDPLESGRQLGAYLLLVFGGKYVDDTVNSRGRASGMQGG